MIKTKRQYIWIIACITGFAMSMGYSITQDLWACGVFLTAGICYSIWTEYVLLLFEKS